MSNNVTPAVSRTQKSRIFEMVFRDKRELLGLYNAVNGTRYEDLYGTRLVMLPTPRFVIFPAYY